MTSQPGKEIIAIHILPNISKSKGNQAIKFGQLIEYAIRNIFLEKSFIKCGGETILRPFSKKSKLTISLNQLCKVLYSLFSLYVKSSACRNILKLSFKPLAFNSHKTFLKSKTDSRPILPATFSV